MNMFAVPDGMVLSTAPQGSEEWLTARRGIPTGSRFKDMRDRYADTPEKTNKKTGVVTPFERGGPSQKQLNYAMDVAREREGGVAPSAYVNSAMRFGTVQEPFARIAYELRTEYLVEEAGFLYAVDRKAGCSIDGLVFMPGERGGIEVKTMVASSTLFTALVFGDISEYIDQCQCACWLWHLDWIDLVLWAPDLPEGAQLEIIRVMRDDDFIAEMEVDLLAFNKLVDHYAQSLRSKMGSESAMRVIAPRAAEPEPEPPLITAAERESFEQHGVIPDRLAHAPVATLREAVAPRAAALSLDF